MDSARASPGGALFALTAGGSGALGGAGAADSGTVRSSATPFTTTSRSKVM